MGESAAQVYRGLMTDERVERILKAVRLGSTWEHVAKAGGIHLSTLRNWEWKGRQILQTGQNIDETHLDWKYVQFVIELDKAETEAIEKNLELMDKHAKVSWQAAAWKLERRYPDQYGKQQIPISGGVPVTLLNQMIEVIMEASMDPVTVIEEVIKKARGKLANPVTTGQLEGPESSR